MSYRDELGAKQARLDAREHELAERAALLDAREREIASLRASPRDAAIAPITPRERALVAELEASRRAVEAASRPRAPVETSRTRPLALVRPMVLLAIGLGVLALVVPWLED